MDKKLKGRKKKVKNNDNDKKKIPPFLRRKEVKIPRLIQTSSICDSIPNYGVMRKEEQEYYHRMYISNFKDLVRIYKMEIDIDNLPSDLEKLHIIYEECRREVVIANEVKKYKTWISLASSAAVMFGKLASFDLSEVTVKCKEYSSSYESIFYQIAIEKYDNSRVETPNPQRELFNMFAMTVGCVAATKLVSGMMGNGTSMLFGILLDTFLSPSPVKTQQTNIKEKQYDINPVPPKFEPNPLFGIFG